MKIDLSRTIAECPVCAQPGKRHSAGRRKLRDICGRVPAVLEVVYTKHFCIRCRKFFSVSMVHLADPASRYTLRIKRRALDMLREGVTLERVRRDLRRQHRIDIPATTLHDWRRMEVARGEAS